VRRGKPARHRRRTQLNPSFANSLLLRSRKSAKMLLAAGVQLIQLIFENRQGAKSNRQTARNEPR
jgi:hypothetical protein